MLAFQACMVSLLHLESNRRLFSHPSLVLLFLPQELPACVFLLSCQLLVRGDNLSLLSLCLLSSVKHVQLRENWAAWIHGAILALINTGFFCAFHDAVQVTLIDGYDECCRWTVTALCDVIRHLQGCAYHVQIL